MFQILNRPIPIRQEQSRQPVPPTRPIGRRAEQLGGNRPKLSVVRNEPPIAHAVIRPVFESGVPVRFGGKDWELVEDDGVISTIRGVDERGRVVDRQVITKDLLAYGNRPVSMQDRPDGVGVRAAQGSESPAVKPGKLYHVRPGQDVYVLRSSGKIEKGWEVKHIDGQTGKVKIESVDGQGRSLSRDDPSEFIDDLNRPTVPEDIGKIDFDKARTKTALERREMIIHVVRRLKDGGLRGSKGFSRSDQLVTELQTLFDHPSQDGINLLTNAGGLRDKVRELLNTELTEQRSREK